MARERSCAKVALHPNARRRQGAGRREEEWKFRYERFADMNSFLVPMSPSRWMVMGCHCQGADEQHSVICTSSSAPEPSHYWDSRSLPLRLVLLRLGGRNAGPRRVFLSPSNCRAAIITSPNYPTNMFICWHCNYCTNPTTTAHHRIGTSPNY